jgi:hypothetical protein
VKVYIDLKHIKVNKLILLRQIKFKSKKVLICIPVYGNIDTCNKLKLKGDINMINLNNKFNTTEESRNKLMIELDNLVNKEDTISVIKYDGFELKNLGGEIIRQEPRGIIYFKYTFSSIESNISIYVTLKDRYIKTKDKLLIKSIENVEIA